jgi:hypothetical protein
MSFLLRTKIFVSFRATSRLGDSGIGACGIGSSHQ